MKNMSEQELIEKIQDATKVSLRDDEHTRIRSFLSEYLSLKPAAVREAATPRLTKRQRSMSYLAVVTYLRRPMPAFIVALILLVSGGTAVAAEGALPGDILYPVKVGVTEEVRETFSLSTQARSDWAVKRAERRLEEASALALKHKLDANTRAEIDKRLKVHVEEALEGSARLEAESETEAAVDTETRLRAVLGAHERVLAQVRSVIDDADIRANLDSILANIAISAGIAARAESAFEAQVQSRADISLERAAEGRREAAKARIEAAEKFLARINSRVSEGTKVEAQTKITAAQNLYTEGEAALEANDAEKAYANFMAAFRTAVEAHTYLAAHLNALNIGLEFKIFSRNTETSNNDDGNGGQHNEDDTDRGSDSNEKSSDTSGSVNVDVSGSTGANIGNENADTNNSAGASASGSADASAGRSGAEASGSAGGGINIEL